MTARPTFASEPLSPPPGTLSAGSFNDLLHAFEHVGVPLTTEATRAAAQRKSEAIKRLIEGDITDAGWRALLQKAREAAERGAHECLLLRFPSDACSDRGRALAEQEAGWGATLTGDAAAIYHRWQADLAPHGFVLSARIMEYPGGMPGDAALFLGWPAA